MPARDDLRPLYLNTQGLYVGKSGNVLKIKEKEKVVQEVRIGEMCQLNLFGNIQISTQAIQALCESEVPIAYFSKGGWFYGMTQGLGVKNIYLRREQFRLADVPGVLPAAGPRAGGRQDSQPADDAAAEPRRAAAAGRSRCMKCMHATRPSRPSRMRGAAGH